MEILVNREPLDYTLESETSLGEVVDGVQEWLQDGKFTITSLDINNEAYPIHDRQRWQDIELDSIRRLEIEAIPLTNDRQTRTMALIEFLEILEDSVRGSNETQLRDAANELPYVREQIARIVSSQGDAHSSILADERLNRGLLPDEQSTAALEREIANLKTLLLSRAKELVYPLRELAVTLGALRSFATRLEDVPVLLQTGKEGEAMQIVVTLTELLSRVYRVAPLAEQADDADQLDLASLRSLLNELAPPLRELEEAFHVSDTVLVGDLLEYEIAPRLLQLDSVAPTADGGKES
ncbi:MAG: hypothetical protein ACLFNT_11925 [Spirochaetales bacterium]